MYLAPCYIRDSNPTIWRRLMAIGLHPNACLSEMSVRTPEAAVCTIACGDSFYTDTEDNIPGGLRDCGTDIDLFRALAALRDDSDLHQWFIYDNRHWNNDNPEYYWFVCPLDSVADFMGMDNMYEDCTKARPSEIKAYFNGFYDDDISSPK